MNGSKMKTLWIVCACIFLTVSFASAEETWELSKDIDGIPVYSKRMEGTGFKAFKATSLIPASMVTIGAVLKDIPEYPKWAATISHGEILETYNARDMELYIIFDYPFPTKDRDALISSKSTVDPDNGNIVITSRISDKELKPPQKGMVRVPKMLQEYVLAFKDSHQTEVTYSVFMDSGGLLPPIAVNSEMMKSISLTLTNLKSFVNQDKYLKADPFDRDNIGITRASMRGVLKPVIPDPVFMDLALSDTDIMRMMLTNGLSENGKDEIESAIFRKYIQSPHYSGNIKHLQENDILSRLSTQENLLDKLLTQKKMKNLILHVHQGDADENDLGELIAWIKQNSEAM